MVEINGLDKISSGGKIKVISMTEIEVIDKFGNKFILEEPSGYVLDKILRLSGEDKAEASKILVQSCVKKFINSEGKEEEFTIDYLDRCKLHTRLLLTKAVNLFTEDFLSEASKEQS